MKPTLVKLNQSNLMDIPKMLRRLADEIETEKRIEHAIVVLEPIIGDLEIRGYGRVADRAREAGILFRAAMQL